MNAVTGPNPVFRSPPGRGRIAGRMQRLVRDGLGRIGNSANLHRGLLVDDMADLSARAIVYVLAVLGLLHVLGLVAVQP